ncbi:MAG: acetoin dehydrogenase dihydrolipoyllysine-residue acetyltransferase subunit [Alphaproteobacteria bacterium]
MSEAIQAVVMPKWGLAMQEGTLTDWHVAEGDSIAPGKEICDIETSKIANALEATISGTVKRLVAKPGETLPVGALMAVVVNGAASDADIDAFVKKFEDEFAELMAAAEAAAPKAQSAEIDGRKINYLQVGQDGPAVVFIHGFGGDLNNWMFNQPVLASNHRTFALDLPGHGASSKSVGDGSFQMLVDTVAKFLDVIDVDKAHLVGHSLGGAIAIAVAAAAPGKVASLTLVSPAGLGGEINMDYINGFIGAQRRNDMKPVLQMLFGVPELVTRDMVNEVLKFKRLDGVEGALKTISGAVFAGGKQAAQLRDQLAGLAVPVRIIWGELDRILPPGHGDGLAGNVKVTKVGKVGHMAHMEVAADVNKMVEEATA